VLAVLRSFGYCLLAAVALLLQGCAGEMLAPDERATLEVYSWWRTTNESTAFDALVGNFTRSHSVEVIHSPRDSGDTRDMLSELLLAGAPPATFQANAGADLLRWATVQYDDGPGEQLISDVTPLLERTGALDAVYPEVLNSTCLRDTERDTERYYGVPVNVHRLNLLYFNIDDTGPSPDLGLATLCPEDIFTTQRLPGIAIAPEDGWSLTLLAFENLLPALTDEQFYEEFFKGNPPESWETPLRTMLSCFWYMSQFFVDAGSWDKAVGSVVRGSQVSDGATLTITGDWANPEFADALGDRIGRIPFPGTQDIFVFTSDTFPLPVGTRHERETRALLESFLLPDTQIKFSAAKGSIPARRIDDESMWDRLSASALESRDAFRDNTRILATSGRFPSYFPAHVLNTKLATLSGARPDQVSDFVEEILDFLHSGLPLLKRWHEGLSPRQTQLALCEEP
jgi:glucose/mannose transport system substrate-binding protein